MGRIAARTKAQQADFRRLQEDFDVTMYQTAQDLKTWQLHNELSLRLIAADDVIGAKAVPPEQHVERILTAPLSYTVKHPPRPPFGSGTHRTVEDTTVRRLVRTAQLLIRLDAVRAAYQSWAEPDGAADEEMPIDADSVLDTSVSALFLQPTLIDGAEEVLPLPYADSPCITINIDAPDKVIEADFKLWLQSKRREREAAGFVSPTKTQFTPSLMHAWTVRHQVLAYLDLKYLLNHFDLTLTREEVGALIYPHYAGDDLQSKIGDLDRSLEQLMTPQNLSALAMQAQSDYSEWQQAQADE